MRDKFEALRKSALLVAGQYKSRNLREFIPRRVDDRIAYAMALGDEGERQRQYDELVRFVEVCERQAVMQNMYHGGKTVLDE